MIFSLSCVAAGGALGALLRYLISLRVNSELLPLSLIPNLTGCFLMGVLLGLFPVKLESSPNLHLFLITGVLGSLTTFSTYSFEAFEVLRADKHATAFLMLAVPIVAGLFLLFLGLKLGHVLRGI